ncbi:hypothetical protein GJ744_000754 [Endocarpon pusillum]|uniref:Uncharacterized protein n=1 Tax=Endocarpon pusillum TaxID=364733 RepID=A0A8H7AEA9_9EURO|nr:hypothetical protein GJ744_000754 [Endocarpon pusillum]
MANYIISLLHNLQLAPINPIQPSGTRTAALTTRTFQKCQFAGVCRQKNTVVSWEQKNAVYPSHDADAT